MAPEPAPRRIDVALVELGGDAPEVGTMVHVREVRDLVRDDVAAHLGRREDQPPAVGDPRRRRRLGCRGIGIIRALPGIVMPRAARDDARKPAKKPARDRARPYLKR